MFWWEVMKRLSLYESDPPAGDPEAEPAGDPEAGGGEPTPPEPEEKTIPVEVLPEELRDMEPAQAAFMLKQMVSGLGRQRQQVEDLERRLAGLETPPEPELDLGEDKPLNEQILDEPDKAVLRVLKDHGLLDRFTQMETEVGQSSYTAIRAKDPDLYDEHEEEVKKIIHASGRRPTPDHVAVALEIAVGRAFIAQQQRDQRKTVIPDTPKPTPPKKEEEHPELFGLEAEVFAESGMTREEWEYNKSGKGFDDLEVPT